MIRLVAFIVIFTSFMKPVFAENLSVSELCNYEKKSEATRIGLARDSRSQEPLYCEYHFWKKNPVNEVVEYRDLDNRLIVEKTLDYSNGRLSPNVLQNDLRHGELREVNKQKVIDKVEQIVVDMAYRSPNNKKIKKGSAKLSKNDSTLVIDGGFDYAMLANWKSLYASETVKFNFASPVHRKVFNLSINRTDKELCGQRKLNKVVEVCYLMTPSNTVLSWFVKPVELIYSVSPNRLKVFSGDVNITNKKGKTYKAVIEYIYN